MRIAYFVSGFPALSETFLVNQIVDLIRKGHEVDIFATRAVEDGLVHQAVQEYQLVKRTTYLDQLPNERAKKMWQLTRWVAGNFSLTALQLVKRFVRNASAEGLSVYQLALFNRRKQYDVVHAHFGVNGVFVTKLRKLGLFKKCLFVTTFHGYDLEATDMEAAGYHDLFADCDWFTVNSNFSKAKLTALGCPPQKIQLLPVGLDPNYFNIADKVKTANELFTILFVGRLVPFKAPDIFIEICALLKNKKGIRFQAIMIGEGEMKEQVKQLLQVLDLEAEIQLMGAKSQQEIKELMSRSDVFLYPGITCQGRAENQGLVIQEAQAMELPVIVSDAGGMGEGVLDGETGYVLPERHLQQFADKLEELCRDREKRLEMGRLGREFVRQHFSIGELNTRLLAIYSAKERDLLQPD